MANFIFPKDPMEICRCLYSSNTYFHRCVGFCDFHKAYLTEKQLKTKNCLGKNCNALIRQNAHPFWVERSLHKLDSKLRKEEAAAKLNSIESKAIENSKNEERIQKQKRYICLDLKTNKLTSKERKPLKGLKGEVIQIGAVMLDENFNCISQFNSYVKPVYGSISEEITRKTEITNDTVAHADTFRSVINKLYSWAGKGDISTFCWNENDYRQLWDEIYIKARNHDEYNKFLKTFVDLQAGLDRALNTKESLSMDAAMKLCHLKLKGQRHTAFADAINIARILNKVQGSIASLEDLPKLSTYVETNIAKRFDANISKDKDYTSSFASFISPEIWQQLGYNEDKDDRKVEAQVSKQDKTIKFLSEKINFIKYGVKLTTWLNFSVKMVWIKDMKIQEAA